MTENQTIKFAALASRLRDTCTSVRTKPFPLSDLIPLMQQAADALSTVAQPPDFGPQAQTPEEAVADVGKWLNERPNRPLDLRSVAMLVAAAARPGWMPISEAPKDGTELLLISAKGRIANGCWMSATDKVGGWMWPYINQEPFAYMPMLPLQPSTNGESK